MKHLKSFAALALILVFALPTGAHAAADRGLISGFQVNGDGTIGILGYLLENNEYFGTFGPTISVTNATSSRQVQTTAKSWFLEEAVNNEHNLTNGITWLFPSWEDIDATIATAVEPFTPSELWHNGAQQTAGKRVTFSGTTTSGAATFYLTDNGLSGGNALCPNSIRHVNVIVNDPANTFGLGYAVTNSNKTLTITANVRSFSGTSILGITVLGSSSLTTAPNGTALGVAVDCN